MKKKKTKIKKRLNLKNQGTISLSKSHIEIASSKIPQQIINGSKKTTEFIDCKYQPKSISNGQSQKPSKGNFLNEQNKHINIT